MQCDLEGALHAGFHQIVGVRRANPKWARRPVFDHLVFTQHGLELGAEAVICIANKQVTWNVVQELESRGIPAFGAIWDS